MTLEELKSLQQSGEFHHATYRDVGKCWEGLCIYVRATDEHGGSRGFKLYGRFTNYWRARNPECEKAMEMIKGLHVGSFGNG